MGHYCWPASYREPGGSHALRPPRVTESQKCPSTTTQDIPTLHTDPEVKHDAVELELLIQIQLQIDALYACGHRKAASEMQATDFRKTNHFAARAEMPLFSLSPIPLNLTPALAAAGGRHSPLWDCHQRARPAEDSTFAMRCPLWECGSRESHLQHLMFHCKEKGWVGARPGTDPTKAPQPPGKGPVQQGLNRGARGIDGAELLEAWGTMLGT